MIKLGFIGFGEAPYNLTQDYKPEQVTVFAYDKMGFSEEFAGQLVRKRAAERKVTLVKDYEELFTNVDYVFNFTSGALALPIAKEVKQYIKANHIYVDMNTASPMTEEEIEKAFEGIPGQFIDVGVMAPLPSYQTRVPMVCSGKGAKEFAEVANSLGMDVKYLNDTIGTASMMKNVRSVFMKNLIATLTETTMAAYKYDIVDEVLESLRKTVYEETTWLGMVNQQVTGIVVHSVRFGHEMEEVAKTLDHAGIDATMTKAAIEKMNWMTESGLKKRFNDKGVDRPEKFTDVLAEYYAMIEE